MKKDNLKHAIVSTDVVFFFVNENKLYTITTKVQNEEYKGKSAFPGALIRPEENSLEAVKRVIKEKLLLDPNKVYLEELGSYSEVKRDVRGRVVSIAYIGLTEFSSISSLKKDNTEIVEVKKVKGLAYDHMQILSDAQHRIKSRFSNSTIASRMLGEHFTMSELFNLYNLVLDKQIDKRNFIKKIKSLDIIKDSGKELRGQKNRPAKLMQFKKDKVIDLEIF